MRPNDLMPPGPHDSIVDCRTSTREEVLRRLDVVEQLHDSVQTAAPDEDRASILAACEGVITRIADRNVHLLTPERYRAAIERVTERERFEIGTLSAVTRFVRRIERIPPRSSTRGRHSASSSRSWSCASWRA